MNEAETINRLGNSYAPRSSQDDDRLSVEYVVPDFPVSEIHQKPGLVGAAYRQGDGQAQVGHQGPFRHRHIFQLCEKNAFILLSFLDLQIFHCLMPNVFCVY